MASFWRDHPWRLRLVVLLAAALAVLLLQWRLPVIAEAVEQSVGDWAWRLGASDDVERRVVVVDIDEASLDQVGAWPWSRETLARLGARLHEAGASVQVYDLVLDAARPGDDDLRQMWQQWPVVAGQIFSLDTAAAPRVGEVGGAMAAAGCPSFAPLSQGHVANSPSIVSPGLAVGHLTPRVSFDGVVRKVPAVICHEGRAYPSLPLAALWRLARPAGQGQAAADWQVQGGSGEGLASALAPAHVWVSAMLPGVRVPVDSQGDLRVPYRLGRASMMSIPAARVLDGSVDLSVLRGTIALVGATAFGIGDVTSTPLASVASGVEVHAQVIAGLLDHRVPHSPASRGTLLALTLLTVSLVLSGLTVSAWGAPARRLPLAGVAMASLLVGASLWALLAHDLWLPWFSAAMFALLAATSLATAEHALTRAQRARLSAHLGSYLPAPVAQRLMTSEPSGTVQAEPRQVTVLVADMRNFSAFASHRPPEQTAALLHAFYCIAVDVIEQHGGVVENIVGDSVMGIWNAYSACQDHGARALAAARELTRATCPLFAGQPDADPASPVQPLALGVGLESGRAVVGSFGPARRRAHAALGEPVSVASRLQQMTQDLSMPILIGPQLAAGLPQASLEGLGDYLLEGMSRQYALSAPADWASLLPAAPRWGEPGPDLDAEPLPSPRWVVGASGGAPGGAQYSFKTNLTPGA